jgi:hypothetical protein
VLGAVGVERVSFWVQVKNCLALLRVIPRLNLAQTVPRVSLQMRAPPLGMGMIAWGAGCRVFISSADQECFQRIARLHTKSAFWTLVTFYLRANTVIFVTVWFVLCRSLSFFVDFFL